METADALVRQTESELVAQGAFVAAAYRAAFERAAPGAVLRHYGRPLLAAMPIASDDTERWRPQPARLDLAVDRVWPPPDPASRTAGPADRYALAVGKEITTLMREAQNVTLAAIRVVDPRGTVVATTGEELGLSLAERREVVRALGGEHVSLLRARVSDKPSTKVTSISRSTGVRVFVATPIVHHDRVLGAVVLARTPASLIQTLYRHRGPLIAGFGIVLAAVLAVSLFTAFTIARPVAAVIRQTERARRGEKGAVVPLERPVTREIAQLSQAVATLAGTLESRADYIRNFAAHVSHEFKTPLTGMQGAVELLREHGATMSATERERFLENLAANTERLERLVRRLLELARADMVTPGDEACATAPLLEHLAERLRGQGVRVAFTERVPKERVAIAEETLESVLTNLVENARQHGGPQVNIQIGASLLETSTARLEIVVQDDGPGVSAANATRIFEPFFTTARGQGGTGLGLAVVKALVEAHGGGISLLPSSRGAAFALHLPLA